ncbi:MAG: ABC1 kinase family protein [Sphaerospermopsis kisseleviana]
MKDNTVELVKLPDNIADPSQQKQSPKKLWSRRLAIFNFAFSFLILLLWDGLTRRLGKNQQLRAKILVEKLINMGPTFIKLGQLLSCRPDLIPPIYVDELANLQDQLPPFANEEAYNIIEEEFGIPYNQVYAELNPDPVASASLGQVYKGKLHTGEIVAVKVQRPGIIEILVLDIYLLQQLASWVQKNVPFIHTNIRALTDELANSIFKEMDYVKEGANGKKFAEIYNNIPHIYIPYIYSKYTTSRVLTMEWVNGVKITSIEELCNQGLNPADLMSLEFKFFLQQLLEGRFFHADPHPGNVLVTADGKLAFLDFGMMSAVEPETSDLLIIFFLHFISGDFQSMAEDLVALEFLPPETDLPPLIPRLSQLFGNNVRESTIVEFGFRQIFDKLLSLVYEYSWQIPKFYVLVFRAFATIEGVAIKLNPDFQAYKVGFPYIVKWTLTKRSPVLWDALKNLCVKNETIQWELVSDLLTTFSQIEDFNLYIASERMIEFLYSDQGNSFRYVLVKEMVTKLEGMFDNMMSLTMAMITPFEPYKILSRNWDNIQPFIRQFLASNLVNFSSAHELSEMFLRKTEAMRLEQEILTELGKRILMRFISV